MKKIILYFLLTVCITFTSCAQEIPKDFLESLPFEAGDGSADEIEKNYNSLIERMQSKITDEIAAGMKKGANILLICGMCAVAGIFKKSDEDKKGERIVETAGMCLLLMANLTDTKGVVLECRDAISEIGVFSKILLPLMAMWASCAGKPLSAVAVTGGAMAYTSVCCAIAEKLIFALIIVFILLKTSGMAGNNMIAIGLADGLKNSLLFAVKICLMGISFYMTMSGCIMSAGDSASVKTIKAAVSVLPGIGSAVAGVTESVIAGASVIRNSIGVLGVIAILFFVMAPFVKLFVNMIMFKIIGIISAAFTSDMIAKTIEIIADGYSMALGILAAASGGIIMSVAVSILIFGG